jgi:hypothetical protein
MRPLALLLLTLLMLAAGCSQERPGLSKGEALERWQRHETDYRKAAELFEEEGVHTLPTEYGHLSVDGRVIIERIGEEATATFVLDTWGIDNSLAIVRLGTAEPPRSSLALEQWANSQPIAEGWFLVEGT